ncbi:hypothetical protein GFL38_32620 [Rhizobium leguminosarum bv. viciae]|uniref:COG3904 family protein n=1 Tax=Rhizobium ruizarguesonis TaxID=2081791 RepID=UPI00143F0E3A|nr:hypothetical protein [Rhizobium ruizarguesonis]NKJ76917.1 hypothetical protein [Rhizobium leguminosarum bv. viciae]NKQ74960.1 hypothetical protein [Rhizobium ruizarguesonis]NKQ82045.1 hypothetical protein [Rhizobium ruizarguesonis]
MGLVAELLAILLIAVALVGVGPQNTAAAITYERLSLDDGGRLLVIKGEFEPSDDPMKLVAVYSEYQPTVISFDSNGGSVVAAIKIGRAIRALSANTVQIRSTQCASACALAFLGGVKRSAEAGSIGVHQASFSDDAALDNKTAVATVQTMTGEIIGYLSDMGVSPNLLRLSLSIESSDMRYLTTAEMHDWNIITSNDAVTAQTAPSFQPGDKPVSSPSAKAEATATAPRTSGDNALEFIRRYHEAWSGDNSTALAFMHKAYADQVTFYGKVVDRDAVMKDKGTFAQRWPERIYSVKPGSEAAVCAEKCDVSGVIEWFARSRERGKTSSGMAEFAIVWNPATSQIESENSKVLATDRGAQAPERIISQWHVENGECRGSTSPDSPETQTACARREEIGAMLDTFGWCYGHKNDYGYQMKWHLCDPASNRP